MLDYANYITFWKRQNYGDSKKIKGLSEVTGEGGMDGQDTEDPKCAFKEHRKGKGSATSVLLQEIGDHFNVEFYHVSFLTKYFLPVSLCRR